MNQKVKKAGYDDYVAAGVQAIKNDQYSEAFDYACNALQYPNAGHLPYVIFALSVMHIKVLKFDPIIRQTMINVLGYNKIDNNQAMLLWLQMFDVDPAVAQINAMTKTGAFTKEDWPQIENDLNDAFFIEGLRNLTMMTTVMEMFLRSVRRVMLLDLYPKGVLKTKNLPFICALAEQCFFNEYNYFVSDDEKKALKTLPKDDAIAVSILACYEALHDHDINVKLSAVAGFRKMITTQVHEPMREFELMKEIKSFAEIQDDVTKNVQAMYEQNPYPRWKSIDMPTLDKSDITGDVLIAGCGTGRTTNQVAFLHPNINLTSCDISRRSIAYAKRIAETFGNHHISFQHRDIMTLHQMDKKFDFIECSGVLHHMPDPVAGWKQLIERLKPGGFMLICLYSKKARANIQAVRELVAERGLSPTPDNIRLLRTEIIDQQDHPLRKVIFNRDFYSLSETRDLVFHIQEKTYTTLELKDIMDDLGLELVRLKITDGHVLSQYKQMFPDDTQMTNLENWDKYEDEYPNTFIGMYKFMCKIKGDRIVNETAIKLMSAAYGD